MKESNLYIRILEAATMAPALVALLAGVLSFNPDTCGLMFHVSAGLFALGAFCLAELDSWAFKMDLARAERLDRRNRK